LPGNCISPASFTSAIYRLEEVTFQSLADRRVHAWLAIPKGMSEKTGAVLALHGHKSSGEEGVKGIDIYWYGRRLAELGYVVIAPDIGSHKLQPRTWSLEGERVWDALRCLDHLQTRPEVERSRLAACGLSLGGQTTMYVAALDKRIRIACCSGWLTTIANMKNGHCSCWNFPGLEEHFEFSDIFACVAPRRLLCEVGKKERAPGGFPAEIAQTAFAEIQPAFRLSGAEDGLKLDVHGGGHVFVGRCFWEPLSPGSVLRSNSPAGQYPIHLQLLDNNNVLGNYLVFTNSVASAVDNAPAATQRFYRVRLLP
jgi:hypothetical protein